MSKPRLTIIVPYRDRPEQLQTLVGGLASYFERDKYDLDIPYRVLVIEQEPGLPFNRGATKNIGFILAREAADYVCFHDVDFLPIWADYSFADLPTPIAWYGAITRPVAAGSNVTLTDTAPFAPVVLCPIEAFAKVGGYANQYWGWGMEDTDLRKRFEADGIALGRRKGTFQPLLHNSDGYHPDGTPNAIALANKRIFENRWPGGMESTPVSSDETRADGLSSCQYHILNRRPIPNPSTPERGAVFEKITVRLDMKPSPEQRAALKAMASR